MDTDSKIHKDRLKKADESTSPLRSRWEEDFRMYCLDPSYFNIPANEGRWDSFIPNSPAVHANTAVETISNSDRRLYIPIEYTKKQDRKSISQTERLINGSLFLNDERLLAVPEAMPLQAEIAWYACVRGWIALRAMLYKDNGDVRVDVAAWDPYNTYWISGYDGIIWCCYRRFADPSDVREQYGITVEPDTATKLVSLLDVWEGKQEGVIVESTGEWAMAPEDTGLNHAPILVLPVGVTPRVHSSTYSNTISQVGESIFKNDRNQYKLISRIGSYYMTMAGRQAKTPTRVYYDGNLGGAPEFDFDPTVKGANIKLDTSKGQKMEDGLRPEMAASTFALLQEVLRDTSIGGIAPIVAGFAQGAPAGVTVRQLTQGALRIINSFIKATELSYEWVANELSSQYKNNFPSNTRFTVRGVDPDGKRYMAELSPKDISDEHHFICELVPNVIEDEQANIAMATQAVSGRLMSRQTAQDKFHLVKDTDLESDIMFREEAETIVFLKLRRLAKALRDDGDDEGADMVMETVQQMMAGDQQGTPSGTAIQPGIGIPAPARTGLGVRAEEPNRLQRMMQRVRGMAK